MLAIKKMGSTAELKRFFVILISLLGLTLVSAELQAKTVSDPNHQGWTGKHPKLKQVTWKPIETKCDKCTKMASQYNETVQELLNSRYWVHFWREVSKNREKGKQDPFWPGKGDINDFEAKAVGANLELFELQQAQLELHKKAALALEQQASYLSAALIECERTACKVKKPSKLKGITIGGNSSAGTYQPDVSSILQQYGIDWKGPYRTKCKPCQPIAAQLNALPGWVVRSHMKLQRAELTLKYYEMIEKSNKVKVEFLQYHHPDKTNYSNAANAVKQLKAEIEALKKLFKKLSSELPLCERKFCPALKSENAGFIPGTEGMPISTCPEPASNEAITVGPNSEIGSKADFKEKTKKKVAGVAAKAITGLLGIGSGGGSSKYDGPITERDPIKKKHKLKSKDKDVKRELLTGGSFTPEGLLISNDIKKAPGNGTFQTIYLENPRGWRIMPIGTYLYEIWRNWKLSVSWTKDTYVDGEHVKHEEGGWTESWSELLASGEETIYGEVADKGPLWEQLGFNTAVSGARSIGTVFPITEDMLAAEPMNLVVHVTDPKKDPVITYPYIFAMTPGDDGTVQLERVDKTIASQTPCKESPEFYTSPLDDISEDLALIQKESSDIESTDIENNDLIEGEYGLLDMNLRTMKYQFFDTYKEELPAILAASSTQERVALTQAVIDDITKVHFSNNPEELELTEEQQRQFLHTFLSEEMPFLSTLATKESSPLELKAARDSLYKNLMEHDPELAKEFDRVLKKRKLAYQYSTEGYDLRNQSHELKVQRDELTDSGIEESADQVKALDEQINELNRKAEVADRNRDFYNKDADKILEQIPETERSFLDSHIRHKDKLKMENKTKDGVLPVIDDVQGVVPLS